MVIGPNNVNKLLTETQSFSGSDINIIISLNNITGIASTDTPRLLTPSIQTISISSTTSVRPVRACGVLNPRALLKGGRTFAGTMIFTMLGQDPFHEIFAIDVLNDAIILSDGDWHVDRLPPFDIIIVAHNELGYGGVQIIHDATITNWGTTYSVDDMYTESQYIYMAKHVSPFVSADLGSNFLRNLRNAVREHRTPDDLLEERGIPRNRLLGNPLRKNLIVPNSGTLPGFISSVSASPPGGVYLL